MDSRKLAYIAGFTGGGVLTLGLFITALAYKGEIGENYSLSNHLISELGQTNLSELWPLFSITLIVGAISFGIFMVGVGAQFERTMRWFTQIGGVLVALFGALVGFFPLDVNAVVHSTVATIFFFSGMVVVTVFTFHLFFGSQSVFPKWMGIAGIPMVICAAIFLLASLVTGINGGYLNPPMIERSAIEPVMLAEWGVLIFLLAWGITVSIHLAARRRGTDGLLIAA